MANPNTQGGTGTGNRQQESNQSSGRQQSGGSDKAQTGSTSRPQESNQNR